MVDTWEIWDLAEENTSEKRDNATYSPILSTTECTVQLSESGVYRNSSDEELRISSNSKTKHDAYISEDSGIVIPNKDDNRYSPTMNLVQRAHSRNSIRSSSLSGSDDNIGLTNSYTVEEPGRETKHVLVLSGKHRNPKLKSASSTSSVNTDCQNNLNRRLSLDLGHQHLQHSNTRLNSSCESLHLSQHSRKPIRSYSVNSDTTTKEIIITTSSLESSLNDSYNKDNKNETTEKRGNESKERFSFLKKTKSIDTLNKIFKKNIDGHSRKYQTDKTFSSSTSVITNVYNGSPNNNIQSSITPSTTQKINKSIFAKAKHIFKRPLKRSTSLTEFETSSDNRVEPMHNKTYPVDSNQRIINTVYDNKAEAEQNSEERRGSYVADYTTTTAKNGEEKLVLIMSKPRGSEFDKTACLEVDEMFLRENYENATDIERNSNSFQNSIQIVDIKRESSINISKGKNPTSSVLVSGITKINRVENLSQVEESNCNINEDDYDIIEFISPENEIRTDVMTADSSSQTDINYDITFKPETSFDGNTNSVNDNQAESGIKAAQNGLISLITSVGLGEVEETQHVVANMNLPHSVEEHGEFVLHCVPAKKDEEGMSVNAPEETLESTTPVSSSNITDNIHDSDNDTFSEDLTNSDLEPDKVEYSGDDEFVDLSDDSDEQAPLTSTPLHSPKKHSKKNLLTSQNDTKNYRNGTISCSDEEDEATFSRLIIKKEELKTQKQQASSLKKQYGIHDSVNGESSVFHDSSSENDSNTLSIIENDRNESASKKEKEEVNGGSSSIENSFDKDALINRLSKLEFLEKIHSRSNSTEDENASSARKGSSDSLASFEYHEREMLNCSSSGSPVSPAFPSSPATQRTRRKVFHVTSSNGTCSPSSSLNGNSSGPDSLDDEETKTNYLPDEVTERRITVELLNYMPPIEEACQEELLDSELSTKNNSDQEEEERNTEKDLIENIIDMKSHDGGASLVFDVPIDSAPLLTEITTNSEKCFALNSNPTEHINLNDHDNKVIKEIGLTDDITTNHFQVNAKENDIGRDDIPKFPEHFQNKTICDDLLATKNKNLLKTEDKDLPSLEPFQQTVDIENLHRPYNEGPKVEATSDEIGLQNGIKQFERTSNPEDEHIETTEIVVPKKCLWYDYSKDNKEGNLELIKTDQNISINHKPNINQKDIIIIRDRDIIKIKNKNQEILKNSSMKINDCTYENNGILLQHDLGLDSTDGDSGFEPITEIYKNDKNLRFSENRKKSFQKTVTEYEEEDSGTELRYDENHHNNSQDFSNYEVCLENIKSLLHDAELVAQLFLRLANKYGMHCHDKNNAIHTHHLQSARIAYDAIQESNLINFSSVITYLLSYMGAIKSENPLPNNISIPNLLKFLEQLIEQQTMTPYHVAMLTCFLSRSNHKMTAFHQYRMDFLLSCFKFEISQVNEQNDTINHLCTCFRKISEYFMHWDKKLTLKLTKEHLVPHLNGKFDTSFITNVLGYMNLNDGAISFVTCDPASSLLLLDLILRSTKINLPATKLLREALNSKRAAFRFCAEEKNNLSLTLDEIIC